jgi:holliday junction DNA helicase RuvA
MVANNAIAQRLRVHASELARKGDNLYRVRAFRQAAFTVMGLDEPIEAILERSGRAGLCRIPGIGESLAETLEAMAKPEDGCPKPSVPGLMGVCSTPPDNSSN